MQSPFSTVYKFLLLLFLVYSEPGFAQINNLNFNAWTKENGLPSNFVNAVAKDQFGFLWIGTNDGLYRFDGPDAFKIYRKNDGKTSNGLQSNYIRSLYSDSEGNLWIGTKSGGITKFSQTTNTWKTYQYDDDYSKRALNQNDVLSIFEDSNKQIWAGTEYGLNLYDKTRDTFIDFKSEDDSTSNNISASLLAIMEDKNGWLWLGTWGEGLYLLLKDENGNYSPENIRHFRTTSNPLANNVWALDQDKAGRYYLGTHGGGVLVMQLPENASDKVGFQEWEPHFDTYKFVFNESKNNTSNLVQTIHQDKNDDLWIGTCQGLFKVSGKYLSDDNLKQKTLLSNYDVFMHTDDDMTLADESITFMLEDAEQGLIWIGSPGGLNQFNVHTNQFKNAAFEDKYFKLAYAPCIVVDNTKNIWISSPDKGLNEYFIENKKLKRSDDLNDLILGETVFTIKLIDKRWMYVATEAGITVIDLHTQKTTAYPYSKEIRNKVDDVFVRSIFVDNMGFIWCGAAYGLFRINPQAKAWDLYLPEHEDSNAISDGSITSIFEDSRGSIWVSTYYGLNRVRDIGADNIEFESFLHDPNKPKVGPNANAVLHLKEIDGYLYIGTDRGLCGYDFDKGEFEDLGTPGKNYSVMSIEGGVNNDIWISTSEGIINFNKEKKSYRLFDKKDGLGNTNYRLGASYRDADGDIYFASTNGVTYFSPKDITFNEIAPPAYITDIEIDSRDGIQHIDGIYEKEIELNHHDYRLSIEYAAQNYNRPDKNKFLYRMVGLEDTWNEINFGVPIVFTNLKPKEYRLEIKAANNDGVWNDEAASLNITKHPAYWQTWWFRILAIAFVVISILFFIKIYTSNVRKRNARLKQYNDNLNTEIAVRKKVEEQLQEFNDELKRSNRDLEQFAYVASHDLKEPLRVIGGFTKLLAKSKLAKEGSKEAKSINFIDAGIERMTNLIESLLTYSRVGQKDSLFEKFDLDALIQGKVADLSALIKDKNGVVDIEELPDIVGQKEQVGMVFYNLINNALKFNTRERPTVSVREEDDDNHWKFSVKDNGIGIAPEHQDKIFGIFKRLHNKTEFEGTGIGLSVCQKIVLRHEGDIWLESELGKGTTFFFTIQKDLVAAESVSEPELAEV